MCTSACLRRHDLGGLNQLLRKSLPPTTAVLPRKINKMLCHCFLSFARCCSLLLQLCVIAAGSSQLVSVQISPALRKPKQAWYMTHR